jgi:hypothetical protein
MDDAFTAVMPSLQVGSPTEWKRTHNTLHQRYGTPLNSAAVEVETEEEESKETKRNRQFWRRWNHCARLGCLQPTLKHACAVMFACLVLILLLVWWKPDL